MTRLSLVKAILSAQQLFNGANELNRFKGFDNVGIGSDFHALSTSSHNSFSLKGLLK
jgi:hypothetical protein